MAKRNLELSIYTFVLKEKNITKGEFYNLGAFYRLNFMKSTDPADLAQSELYKRFMAAIVAEFKDEFKLNNDGTKAFSTDVLKSYGTSNVVDGTINGGDRGLGHDIFKLKNNTAAISQLNSDELLALPHYFKMWVPPNSQVGVLMIQNYSSAGINTLLLDFLKGFFGKYNTAFIEHRHVPTEIRERFIQKSVVKKVVFAKTKLSQKTREAFNFAFSDSKGLKIKIEITGFNKDKSVMGFIDSLKKDAKLIGADLSALEIFNDSDVKTTLYYEDSDGRKAHAKIENTLSINPTIVLPIDLLDKNSISYRKIRNYTDGILEVVKKEINYRP